MPDSAVSIDRHGHAARLTLTAPAWSSVTRAAVDALARACDTLREDDSVRAVILTGEGDTFCGDWSHTMAAEAERAAEGEAGAFEPLAALPQPEIAAVNGPAHGAALELALAADIRLAATGTTFLLSEGESVPLAGGLTRLSRAVGRATAAWMALTGATLSAEEALAAGLVSAVLAPDELSAEAERLAAVIAARGPIAVRFAKEALRHGPDLTLPQALRYETDLTIILQTTTDRAEGVAAFAEKRPPEFHGR
jgi:enoyl-CoA hydratase/carnithine racemase